MEPWRCRQRIFNIDQEDIDTILGYSKQKLTVKKIGKIFSKEHRDNCAHIANGYISIITVTDEQD